jgi:hypothetical protein
MVAGGPIYRHDTTFIDSTLYQVNPLALRGLLESLVPQYKQRADKTGFFNRVHKTAQNGRGVPQKKRNFACNESMFQAIYDNNVEK